MIRINLLPEEFRKKARTPIKMLLAVAAVAAINAGLASWWAWTVFGIHAKVESERVTLQQEMDGLAPQVTYFHSLEGESKQYKSREKTLGTITTNRISWTRKLDELVDVANAGGEGTRHLVWLDDLNVSQASDPNAKTSGSVRASGHSGSEKFAQVANFLEDLETHAFIDDFEKPAPPEGTQTLVDETLVPPIAWAFPLSLTLKGPEDRSKAAAARLSRNLPVEGEGEDSDGDAKKPDAGKPADPKSGESTPDAGKRGADAADPKPPANDPKPAQPAGAGEKSEKEERR